MIGIVDFGAGNLRSAKKAFDYLGAPATIVSSARELEAIDRMVVPGVGSFGHAAAMITERGLRGPIIDWIRAGRPFLGICLGLQLLYEASDESEGTDGLGVFRGTCRRFSEGKVPQIGWNSIVKRRGSDLLTGIKDGEYFYFVHGYYVLPRDNTHSIATTRYGAEYPSVVGSGRVLAVQFHPEKSGDQGIRLLRNWVERC